MWYLVKLKVFKFFTTKQERKKETMLDIRVKDLINGLDPEFRRPVARALQASDGTLLGFQQELAAMTWDYPMLPVQDILDRVTWDVA